MVERLAKRLEEQPDDANGWILLARSHAVAQRYAESADAYKRAYTLVGDPVEVLTGYADSLATASGGFDEISTELIERALEIDPTHQKALWLSGSVAYEAKEWAKALTMWQRLAALVPVDSEIGRTIASNIAEVRALAGGSAPFLEPDSDIRSGQPGATTKASAASITRVE